MKLSVVIPTYNRLNLLSRTLPTVLAQDFPKNDYEVIVVVDGSTDGTMAFLRNVQSSCSFRVFEQSNQGQAAARNLGVRVARGELVLFLDDDAICDKALLRQHALAHGSDRLFVFGPVLLSPESPRTFATERLRAWTADYLTRLEHEMEPRWNELWACTNSSVPRTILLECGGFDERILCTHDDADLGIRLWKMGVRCRYRASAVAYYIYTKSTRDVLRTEAKFYGRNEVLLSRKHPEYRSQSVLAGIASGALWKLLCHVVVSRFPIPFEQILAAPLFIAENLYSNTIIRKAGCRLLEYGFRSVMLRNALRETGSWRNFRREFGMQLPVLLYHHIGQPQPGTYPFLTVSPSDFRKHISWLARCGYVGIRPSDWLAWVREGKCLPEKPILLTFDDAYADLADYALPVLRRFGFSAGVFVVTGCIGGTNIWDEKNGSGSHRLMNAEQIRQWATLGIEFGAHSRTHADVTNLSSAELAEEIEVSKNDLAGVLKSRITSFAYPYGNYNEIVRGSVSSTFELAFTCEEGLNDLQTDFHRLCRTMVLPSDSLMDLAFRVYFGWSPIQQLRAHVRLRTRIKRAVQAIRSRAGTHINSGS